MRGTCVLLFIFRRKVLTAAALETLQWLRSVGYDQVSASVVEETMSS